MTARREPKNNSLILAGAMLLVGGLLGWFIAHRDNPPEPIILDTHRIDSIMAANRVLEDSLDIVKGKLTEVGKVKVIYKKAYDTIRISQDGEQIIRNLKAIVAAPIPQE